MAARATDLRRFLMCPHCTKSTQEILQTKIQRQHRIASLEMAVAKRGLAIFYATPKWVDRSAIAAIYKEARRISATTGEPHEVDHYYPIQGVSCCGLHIAANLRIVTKRENRTKRHEMPLDHSPALREAIAELAPGIDGVRAEMVALSLQ